MNRNFALIGYPLGHSLSPQIHAKLFQLAGRAYSYDLMEIHPRDLIRKGKTLEMLAGFNVTIPHKIEIIKFCDRLHPLAERYGSVNTVKLSDGHITGYNTDVVGFTKSIDLLGASLKSNVILLGCGGVGRMMAIETAYRGGFLTIAVREKDFKTACALRSEIAAQCPDAKVNVTYLSEIRGEYDLMINATPVGMFPNCDEMPVQPEALKNIGYVFDAVYNPVETALVREARSAGAVGMNGMAMLVLQAAAAHEIWDSSVYETEDLKKLIKSMESYIS